MQRLLVKIALEDFLFGVRGAAEFLHVVELPWRRRLPQKYDLDIVLFQLQLWGH